MRRALVAAVSCAAALAAPGAAVAQAPAPPPLPSLLVVTAGLRQAGESLRFDLRFNRAVPADELDPAGGRTICIILSPSLPSRRRVCVSDHGGRLAATLAAIDETGRASGETRVLHRARVRVAGDALELKAAADALHVRLGGPALTWRVVVTWRDGGPCTALPDRSFCIQATPPQGKERLDTRAPRRPAFERRGRLRLLATGDSMIQFVDGYLTSGLAGRRATVVRSDAHVGTGISKLAMFDWLRRARDQATGFKPDVTVAFLGANDGFPMRTPAGAGARCCDARWIAEYARRVRSMMLAYRRGGRSLVYWLTLPAPRAGNFARVFAAVNPAIRRAAARAGGGVRVIELGPVFTPGGRFRQTVTFQGRTVDARQPDGVHLSMAGARIAAALVVARLRADGALPPRR